MGVFTGFGSWINQNSQEPLKVSLYHQSQELIDEVKQIYKHILYCLLMQAESKRSENGESKSASEKDTNNAPAKKKKKVVIYYDEKEDRRQERLWHKAEKKHPWHNPPPKIKVRKKYHPNTIQYPKSFCLGKIKRTRSLIFIYIFISLKVTNKKGLYHMNIELTVGTAPNIVYYVLTESDPFFDRKKWRDLMVIFADHYMIRMWY